MNANMTHREAVTRILAAALLVAAGNLGGVWLAKASLAARVSPYAGPVVLVATLLAASLLLRHLAGPPALALAIVLGAMVLASAHLLVPDHPELLRRLLPVLGGGAGGLVVILGGPACRRSARP